MIRQAELTHLTTTDSFGGKAKGLSSLASVGAPLPPTLCLSALKEEIDRSGCLEEIESIVHLWVTKIVAGGISAGNNWIVRSSHSLEDSLETSAAGLYPSRVVTIDREGAVLPIAQTVFEILGLLLRNSSEASVILQPFIVGNISGVIFSSDPNEGKYGSGIVTYVNGPCSSLVDGTATPSVAYFSEVDFPPSLHPALQASWEQLLGACSKVEKGWGVPVDCEFTITESGQLFLLQARPISALTSWRTITHLLEVRTGNRLPPSVETHPKVQLRFQCQRSGVAISPAWIATETKWYKLPQFDMPLGSYTSVLLHPHLLNGKVIRKFSKDGYSGTATVLSEASNYWIRHAILTSLIPSPITGIATPQDEKIVIEVARGHFVPKGLVDTTVYEVVGTDVRIVQQLPQRFYFEIDPDTGESKKIGWNGQNSLSTHQLKAISVMVTKLRLEEGGYLEFGVSDEGEAFVIDIQRGLSEGKKLIANRQVVSLGEAEGDLLAIPALASSGADDHFFEFATHPLSTDETLDPVVIAAIRPELGLLREFKKLAGQGKLVVGAIFETYSPLSHLSVLLREWGIPTIVFPNFSRNELSQARRVRVVASGSGGTVTRIDLVDQ